MTMGPGDNPADHNAQDVATFLEGTTDLAEVTRVREAESGDDGKQRVTVLNAVTDAEARLGPPDVSGPEPDPEDDGYQRVPVEDPYPALQENWPHGQGPDAE